MRVTEQNLSATLPSRTLALVGVALAFFLGSCGVLGSVSEAPKAEVQSVSLGSAGLGGLKGTLHLNVFNPNAFSLPVERIDWKLSVGGASPVTGSIELSETLPAKASAPVTSALSISASSAVGIARELAAGTRRYQVQGKVRCQSKFGPISVEFSHEGLL